MRTTADIDPHLLEQARARAANQRTTLSAVVNEALAAFLVEGESTPEKPFALITYGRAGDPCPSLETIERIVEDEDLGHYEKEARSAAP